jgi:hypothetical protein
MLGIKKEGHVEKDKQARQFYMLLRLLMNELFEFASKDGHVKMPYNVSFGLVYDKRNNLLFTGIDQKTGKKVYLYNLRIIANTFEERKTQMTADNTPNSLFNWIYEICSLYINPFVYEHVVNIQHRGKAAADRTTAHIVRGFMNKLLNDPDLKYVLDSIRDEKNKSDDSNDKQGEPKKQ